MNLCFRQVELPNQSVKVAFSTLLNSEDFSQQLEYLNQYPVNGKDDSAYVSQWLVPMLSMHKNSVLRHNEFPIISKKIRDDAIASSKQKSQFMEPFRRCTYWTFMKALLQLNLTIEWGDVNGKIMYKLVMLKVVAVLCNYYATEMCNRLDVDVVVHMLAKLARRIEKINNLLSKLHDEYSDIFETFPSSFADTYNATIDEVKQVIAKVRSKLDQQIAEVQKEHEVKSSLVPLSELDFKADIQQKVPNLRNYLTDRNADSQARAKSTRLNVKPYTRHLIDSLEAPDVTLFDTLRKPIDIGIFLCDIENWILYERYDIGPKALRSLSFGYARLAAQHYKNNPLGYSRAVLTQTKILKLMEGIAIEEHDMLKKHRAGINPDIFDSLILPKYEDCEIAHELKKYFLRRSKVDSPALLEELKLSPDSFSVKFAMENRDMQKVIRLIKQSTDASLATLEDEYDTRRKEVAAMRKKMEGMNCDYYENSNRKREHKNTCARCSLDAKIKAVRVSTIEDPLPESEIEQNAVAFELHIPIEIACLRDVLYVVVSLLNEPAKRIRIADKWIDMNVLNEFNAGAASERIFLGSSVSGKHGRTRTSGKSHRTLL